MLPAGLGWALIPLAAGIGALIGKAIEAYNWRLAAFESKTRTSGGRRYFIYRELS